MLIAPVIAVIEGVFSQVGRGPRTLVMSRPLDEELREHPSSIRLSTSNISGLPVPVSSLAASTNMPTAHHLSTSVALDDPEREFYRLSNSFSVLAYVFIPLLAVTCALSLFGLIFHPDIAPLEFANPVQAAFLGMPHIPILMVFPPICGLLSLLLEVPSSTSKTCKRATKVVSFFMWTGILGLAAVPFVFRDKVAGACLTSYALLSSYDIYRRWQQKKNHSC